MKVLVQRGEGYWSLAKRLITDARGPTAAADNVVLGIVAEAVEDAVGAAVLEPGAELLLPDSLVTEPVDRAESLKARGCTPGIIAAALAGRRPRAREGLFALLSQGSAWYVPQLDESPLSIARDVAASFERLHALALSEPARASLVAQLNARLFAGGAEVVPNVPLLLPKIAVEALLADVSGR